MADKVEVKGLLPIIGIGTVVIVGYALAVRSRSGAKARVSYTNGGYLVSVRRPGEWHDVREFVRPSDPSVQAVYSCLGPDAWQLLNYVCREISYRRDIGEHWLFPHEVLARGEGDCEDTSILLCSLLQNFTNSYVVLGEYAGFGHAWCQAEGGQILETTYDQAGLVIDPEDYHPHFIFSDREAIELWPGGLEQVLSLRRNQEAKIALMGRALGNKYLTNT